MTDDAAPGLELNINTNNNNGNQNYESEDENEIRLRAGLNSPKAQPSMSFDEDENNGIHLQLDENDPTNVTPNTKKRDDININSPRGHNKSDNWSNTNQTAPQSIMTQVARPGTTDPSSLMTQVKRPESQPDSTQDSIKSEMDNNNGGICACFSCLFTCCSSPSPTDIEMNDKNASTAGEYAQADNSDMTLQQTNGSQAGNHTAANGNQSKKDTAKLPLVPDKASNNSTTLDHENSVSDTEYDAIPLLPPLRPEHIGKKCLVLDLDETLVHSSFKPIPDPHFIIPVEIDRVVHHVYVLKRPYVDEFLLRASKDYEIVIFTASLSKYADPLLDKLDIHKVITHRLFRESCVIHGTAYVKDMRKIGRRLADTIIVDNSPPSYLFQPTNAIPILSWFDDKSDTQLLDLCAVLETTLKNVRDVRFVLDANVKTYRWLCNQANKPLTLFTTKN